MNLKTYESNGLEHISVNYIFMSAAKDSGRHGKIVSLYHKHIQLLFLIKMFMLENPMQCMLFGVSTSNTALYT